MRFLASECDDAGATIVYATHIFDGLESWPSHLMYLANGTLKVSPVAMYIGLLQWVICSTLAYTGAEQVRCDVFAGVCPSCTI
jgi:hypothetical protein